AILDTDTETKIGEVALRFDPSPPEVRTGRRFLYDGAISAHGDLACATCHISGNFDNLAWDLGNPLGQMEASLQIPARQIHPMKGPMTTQSLRGLADSSPFHWRGDRLDFTRFNPAFRNLMGAPDSLSAADMQMYNDFIMTVVYPPNPNQTLNRKFAAFADSGRVEFLRLRVFSFPDTMARYEIEAFLLSFDTGMAPSVGRQLTINGSSKNSPGTTALLDSLYLEADLGNCDLIAHGKIAGVMKGFL